MFSAKALLSASRLTAGYWALRGELDKIVMRFEKETKARNEENKRNEKISSFVQAINISFAKLNRTENTITNMIISHLAEALQPS